jgi:endonuclease/exonuclease/phosphatase family metal-dependent hydrolase
LRTTERGATHAQVNRPLRGSFAGWLASRRWDITLLQEAPPRWLRTLAGATSSSAASALTARNLLPRVRGVLAEWSPDLIASNEGGSNQLLVRAPARIAEVRRLTLTTWPERRRMLWARVAMPGGRQLAVANLHATSGDRVAAAREVELGADRAVEWSGDDPLLFGGDLNVRPGCDAGLFERLRGRLGLGPRAVPGSLDHLLARGLDVVDPPAPLPPEERDVDGPDGLKLRLSDHAPVVGTFGME